MTDTVTIRRELLEELRDCADKCYDQARFHGTDGLDDYERITSEADAALAAPVQVPIAMLDLRESAIAASPWAEHAERTGAFVKGAIWHAMTYAAPVQGEAVATVILGGIFHGGSGPELGDIDIDLNMRALERLQDQLVHNTDDVHVELYTTPPQPAEVGEVVELLRAIRTAPDKYCKAFFADIDAALAKFGEKP